MPTGRDARRCGGIQTPNPGRCTAGRPLPGDLRPAVQRTGCAEHGSLGYDGHHGWAVLQGRYTLVVLFEYAVTLGLFDARYTDPEQARADDLPD
jgi:hypothetical protein